MDLHVHIPLWMLWGAIPAAYIAIGAWVAFVGYHWPFRGGDLPWWRVALMVVAWPLFFMA